MARAYVLAYSYIALDNVSIEIKHEGKRLQNNKYLIKEFIFERLYYKIIQKENQLKRNIRSLTR